MNLPAINQMIHSGSLLSPTVYSFTHLGLGNIASMYSFNQRLPQLSDQHTHYKRSNLGLFTIYTTRFGRQFWPSLGDTTTI